MTKNAWPGIPARRSSGSDDRSVVVITIISVTRSFDVANAAMTIDLHLDRATAPVTPLDFPAAIIPINVVDANHTHVAGDQDSLIPTDRATPPFSIVIVIIAHGDGGCSRRGRQQAGREDGQGDEAFHQSTPNHNPDNLMIGGPR